MLFEERVSGVCVGFSTCSVCTQGDQTTGDLNALFSVVFSLCMSHVVGEVTYVELFKDGEGKSRVSVGLQGLRSITLMCSGPVEPIYCRTFDLGTVC